MLFKPGQGKTLFTCAQQAITRTVLGKRNCAIALHTGHLITEDLNALMQIGEQESRQGLTNRDPCEPSEDSDFHLSIQEGSQSFQASLIALLVKNLPAMQETPVPFLGQEDPLQRYRLPTPVFLGFPGSSAGKESACTAGDMGSVPGLERSPGEGKGYPFQYSGLENSMD